MQLTFGDAEGLGKRKQTRREIFLAEMEQVVPWQQLLGLVGLAIDLSGVVGGKHSYQQEALQSSAILVQNSLHRLSSISSKSSI
ncbi:hypothetical protein A7D16_20680 [Xanthomonas nasturtii]|nr:hypothetical protein A7D16_20680 [Xanthomonas nasturtii]